MTAKVEIVVPATAELAIHLARRNLEQDPNLAVFIIRDLPETEAAGLKVLAWLYSRHDGTQQEVAALLDRLEAHISGGEA